METRFEDLGSLTLVGLAIPGGPGVDYPGLWDRLMREHPYEEFLELGQGMAYGVCFDQGEAGSFRYFAGYDLDPAHPLPNGLDSLVLEPAHYLVVRLAGPVPRCIHQGWDWLMKDWFPANDWIHSGQADFERYLPGDMAGDDYVMELWVPVVPR